MKYEISMLTMQKDYLTEAHKDKPQNIQKNE
jgi:hypothetical protein